MEPLHTGTKDFHSNSRDDLLLSTEYVHIPTNGNGGQMRARFWGTRGSLPAAADTLNLRQKMIDILRASQGRQFSSHDDIVKFADTHFSFSQSGFYGTNTSCVEITGGDEYVICDAGSGIRDLSRHVMASDEERYRTFHIFLSHLHWDHIQGFPFFMPRYIAGNTVILYGGHSHIEEAFAYQQEFSNISLSDRADIRFEGLQPGRNYNIAGFDVRPIRQNHPGDSYGYRFERNGKTVVYSSDCEHRDHESTDYPFIDFFKDADLLIIDAQYRANDAFGPKENWGHSSNTVVAEVGARAGVKRLCMFHNEPTVDDADLEKFLHETRRYLEIYDPESTMKIDLAYDGLEISV
ncbi:MAG: metallo-beta-lactamase family protein [Deltaproteobacteria bacterium]|nr:metallo-beta-lactamase family protein [Deltaproteobacteria bacterium]